MQTQVALTKVDSGVSPRWQPQETVALIRIKSEIGAAFPASPKPHLWEQVSRKLRELGYHRSAHKCKEKFVNIYKYYKRAKEGRAGRDGKSYKFFAEFEALHDSTITAAAASATNGWSLNPLHVLPTTVNPAPISMLPPMSQSLVQVQVSSQTAPPTVSLEGSIGINFLSDNSASSEGEDDDDEMETETVDTQPQSKKRKSAHDSDQQMTNFVDGLMKQVMQKQEAMHQKFLETIDKREQDRMIREEAWKRQELASLARQEKLTAQERIASASRYAAIVNFLQKITGQTIQLPAVVPPNTRLTQPSVRQNHQHIQNQQEMMSHSLKQPQKVEITRACQPSNTSQVVSTIPEKRTVPNQDLSGGCSLEGTSSKWLKPGIVALIQLRNGMESKFQEEGVLKRLLWEEISAGMQRMGYDRSAMKCKEKWENINKYYKKVKESKKKRPEEARTCPYYHELDALYQKNVIGSTGGNSIGSGASGSRLPVTWSTQHQQEALCVNEAVDKDAVGKNDIQTSNVRANQPEDSVRKQLQLSHGTSCNLGNNVDDSGSCDLNRKDDGFNNEKAEENEKYDDDDDTEGKIKPVPKIQFRTQKVGSCNGGGQAPNSVLAIFQ